MAGGERDEGNSRSGEPVVREVCIVNRLGLHARASAQFVRTAEQFPAEVTVELAGQWVNAKSIMGLLMLAACQGTTLRLRATGQDSQAAVEALADLVARRFGEPE
ncbi:MAG: HPr family phosphocarrier protein [candidate division NC10 bacterium]|nr:HPr family phosphocarrier protein [candidate division NC10 bacterium]